MAKRESIRIDVNKNHGGCDGWTWNASVSDRNMGELVEYVEVVSYHTYKTKKAALQAARDWIKGLKGRKIVMNV